MRDLWRPEPDKSRHAARRRTGSILLYRLVRILPAGGWPWREKRYNFSIFHGLNQDSRITSTRFDVEYYNPLVTTSDVYRRMRWVGIPAVNFTAGSKLVLPLDYYSMCFNRINTNAVFPNNNIKYQVKQELEVVTIYDDSDNDPAFTTLIDNIIVGDVVKLTFSPTTTTTTPAPSASVFYGIFVAEDAKYLSPEDLQVYRSLMFKKLKNSNYPSTPIETLNEQSGTYVVSTATKYDGFFNGISNIGSSVNEKFTVVENIYAQDIANELYNYNDIP